MVPHGPATAGVARGILRAGRRADLPVQGHRARPRRKSDGAHARSTIANYEIYFSLATSLDPALKIIERVKAASQRPVHIVIAGPAEDCGEKVHNLRRAVESLPDKFRSPRLHRFRCASAARLAEQAGRAAAGSRASARPPPIAGLFPAARSARADLPSALASAWNALGRHACSAGPRKISAGAAAPPFAARPSTMSRVLEAWEGAISDDFALTHALEERRQAHRLLRRMSGGHAASLDRLEPARIHQPPNSDHAHLRSPALGHGRGRASELCVHADLRRVGHHGADG